MQARFKNITIEETKQLLENGANIVDIRDQASFSSGHIERAVHLSNENLEEFVQNSDFDTPLVVYCYHGHSSQNAAQFLAEQGFEEVYSMIGGYTQWA